MNRIFMLVIFLSLHTAASEPTVNTFLFNDGTSLDIEEDTLSDLQKSSTVFYDLFQDAQNSNKPIELPFSKTTFNSILSYLLEDQERLTVAHAKDTTLQNVLDTIDTTDLAQVIKAADFLDIPQLVDTGINALLSPHHARQLLVQPEVISALDEISFLDEKLVPIVLKKSPSLVNHILATTALVPYTFTGFGEPVALSGDGSVVACVLKGSFSMGSSADTIVTFSTQTYQELSRIPTDIRNLQSLSLSVDGNLLAAYQTEGNNESEAIITYNTYTSQIVSKISLTEKLRFGPNFSLNSSTISGVSKNALRVWDTITGKVIQETMLEQYQPLKIVHHTLVAQNQSDYGLYDLDSGTLTQQFQKGSGSLCAVGKRRKLFAQMLDATTIGIYQLNTGNLLHRLKSNNTGSIMSLAFSPDGSLFACISTDGSLQIWKTRDGSLQANQQGIAFSPDDKLVVSDTGEFIALFSPDRCAIYGTTHDIQRTISLGSPGAIKSAPLVHSFPITGIVTTFNPQSVVYCSLNRLEQIITQVKKLSIAQLLVLNALFKRDTSFELPEDNAKMILATIEPLDQAVKDLFLKLLKQNNGSNRLNGNQASDENNQQQSHRSFLGTLIHWLKRAVSK